MTKIRPIKMFGKLIAFDHTICPIHITGIFECNGRNIYTAWIDETYNLISIWVDSGRVTGNDNMFLEVDA